MMAEIIDRAFDAASEVSRIDRKSLLERCRFHHITRARQAACFVAYENGATYGQIGNRIGRCRTTVNYGVLKVRERIAADPRSARFVERVRELAS